MLNGYGRVIYYGNMTKYYSGKFKNNKKHGYGMLAYVDDTC